MLLHADDIAILTSGKNKVKLVTSTIEEWFEVNDMTLNYKKSGIMQLVKRPPKTMLS